MQLRPYKFLVQPVVQQVDEEGNVVGEVFAAGGPQNEPIVLFGVKALEEWARDFPKNLVQAEKNVQEATAPPNRAARRKKKTTKG